MEFLRLLEGLRTPFFDAFFSLVTRLGEETVFMAVGMLILWCVDKKWGFRFFLIGLVGNALNQLLKAIFVVPRPWLMEESFTIVESARSAATGYSFPSGHTSSAVTVFGSIAAWQKRPAVTWACVGLILLTAFSRMYLGVHTPLDVGVSLAVAAAVVLFFAWLFNAVDKSERAKYWIGAGVGALALALLFYVLFAPARPASVAEFDEHGVKNAWTLLGTTLGLFLAWWVDARHTHFEVKAVWWAQILKLVLGLALIVALRAGLKALFAALFGDWMALNGLRYFLMTVAGGVLWPMTFPYFAGLGGKGGKNNG